MGELRFFRGLRFFAERTPTNNGACRNAGQGRGHRDKRRLKWFLYVPRPASAEKNEQVRGQKILPRPGIFLHRGHCPDFSGGGNASRPFLSSGRKQCFCTTPSPVVLALEGGLGEAKKIWKGLCGGNLTEPNAKKRENRFSRWAHRPQGANLSRSARLD